MCSAVPREAARREPLSSFLEMAPSNVVFSDLSTRSKIIQCFRSRTIYCLFKKKGSGNKTEREKTQLVEWDSDVL